MSNTALTPVSSAFFETEEAKALATFRRSADHEISYHPRDGQGPFGPIIPATNFVREAFKGQRQDAIFFCDPGTDDAIALFLALDKRSTIKPIMIVPSFGNVGGKVTLNNTKTILSLTKAWGVAIGVGAQLPINSNELPEDAAGEHGVDGLGGAKPKNAAEVENHKEHLTVLKNGVDIAVKEIIRRYEEDGKSITLISTGSMTDVALTLQALEQQNPEAIQKIAGVSIMGGGIDTLQWHTNVTDYSEFNIFQDPLAAKIAFDLIQRYKIPTLVFPLDLTHQTGVREEHEKKWLEQHDNLVAHFAAQMFKAGDFDISRSKEIYGFLDEFVTRFMHDPNTITGIDKPELYDGFTASVDVIVEGEKTAQTVFKNDASGSIFVAVKPDAPGVVLNWQNILSTHETDEALSAPERAQDLKLNLL